MMCNNELFFLVPRYLCALTNSDVKEDLIGDQSDRREFENCDNSDSNNNNNFINNNNNNNTKAMVASSEYNFVPDSLDVRCKEFNNNVVKEKTPCVIRTLRGYHYR